MAIRPNNMKQVIFMFIAIIMLISCMPTLTGCNSPKEEETTQEANPPQTAYIGRDNSPQYVECGTCGAHVLEWWKVRNDANTQWVNVCILCAQKIDEETE